LQSFAILAVVLLQACATILGGQPITGCCDAPLFQAKNLHCNPIVLFMHARQRAARVHLHVCAPEPGSARAQIGGSDKPDVFTSRQARAKYIEPVFFSPDSFLLEFPLHIRRDM
jgi:hypothetical protein